MATWSRACSPRSRDASFKCLVLDLDNTLWGGVIGDDGLAGIVLGQGSALGEAFVAFQRYARDLARRGVILAVCSKNDEANALEPFEQHPEMVLRREDIACFAANWNDKASNLREIAEQLNIGLDALVFADDNPFERNIVRRELPMVAVPELPDDPALLRDLHRRRRLFRRRAPDRRGPGAHAAIPGQCSTRGGAQASTTDLEGYLRSLDMEAALEPVRHDRPAAHRAADQQDQSVQPDDAPHHRRGQSTPMMADPTALTLQLRLLDRFGDNGMIAVVIGRFETASTDMLIDTWLMSCRVLGRGVEQTTLDLVAAEAARLGARRLIGEYRPTAKNGMVREHYARLGFSHAAELEGGVTRWAMPLAEYQKPQTFIRTVEAS